MPDGCGFPRTLRLTKPADFARVFENAQKSADGYLTVLARTNALGHPRLGLAISKRNIRNAVDRNRIKRCVRESFRLQAAELGNLDIVVMARPAARQSEGAQLRGSLERHWNKLVKRCNSRCSDSSESTAI